MKYRVSEIAKNCNFKPSFDFFRFRGMQIRYCSENPEISKSGLRGLQGLRGFADFGQRRQIPGKSGENKGGGGL